MSERVLPHNLEAERAVLGAVVLRNAALSDVADVLRPEMFYRQGHRDIFEQMLALDEKGRPIDPVTLKAALAQAGELDAVGGPAYLSSLVDGLPGTSNARHHAELVRGAWTLRETITECQRTIAQAFDGEDEAEEVLNRASQRLFDLSCQRSQEDFVGADVLMRETYGLMQKWSSHAQTGVPTGFVLLDRMTGGWQPGNLVIVAARPSMGKTSFVLNTGLHAAQQGYPVGVFSVEMSRDEVGVRLATAESRVDGQRLRENRVHATDYERLTSAIGRIEQCPFFVDESGSLSVTDIRARSRRLKSRNGMALLVVDYLQLLVSAKRSENRNLEVAAMTRALKVLAKDLQIPVIALSQLNRDVDTRKDHRPVLSDLRDSGAIEQDADAVLFLYRPEVYDASDENKGKAELIIAKQRNGPTGTIPLTWLDYCTRFENYTEAA